MRRFRSFNHSTCKTVPNLLEAIYLRLRKIVVERVTVVKFGVDNRGSLSLMLKLPYTRVTTRDFTRHSKVMLSPLGQNGLEAKILASASASKLWPRPPPRGFNLGLASISLSNYVIGHFSCKNRVKFGKFLNFSDNNLKSYYVVNHYLVLFHNYFRPRPRPHSPGLGLGLEAN